MLEAIALALDRDEVAIQHIGLDTLIQIMSHKQSRHFMWAISGVPTRVAQLAFAEGMQLQSKNNHIYCSLIRHSGENAAKGQTNFAKYALEVIFEKCN